METTLTAILVSLACCVAGLVIVIFFEEWKIRDAKKTKKKTYNKEVDRLLDLDEYEQKIS